jgi:hypothetical protein
MDNIKEKYIGKTICLCISQFAIAIQMGEKQALMMTTS